MEMPDKHSKRDNAFDKLIRRLNTAKEKISELKDRSNENIKKKKNREKKEEANKGNNHPKSVEQIKWANIYVTGIPEVEE